jgi:hypothetical protein
MIKLLSGLNTSISFKQKGEMQKFTARSVIEEMIRSASELYTLEFSGGKPRSRVIRGSAGIVQLESRT